MATELEIRVTAELREIKAALATLTGDLQRVTQRANQSSTGTRALSSNLSQAATQGRAAATAAGQVRANIAAAVTQVQLLVGGLGAAGLVIGLVRMADTATRLQGQLKLVTKSQEELNRAQEQTFAIAQRTRQGLEGTVNLYARIARTGRTTQQGTLELTESINQAVALSFTTAQAAEAALFQLGQGLGSGTLRGEELNSVLEQTPRLAQAIAEGLVELGKIKDPSGLRAYARENGIAATEVVAAIRTQRKQLEGEFTQLTPTVADAFTALRNAALKFVGEQNAATGASRDLAAAILSIANNLNTIATLLVTGAKLWAAYYVAFRLVPAVVAALGVAFTTVRASIALTTPAMRAFQAQAIALTTTLAGGTAAANAFSLSMTGTAIAAGGMATKLKAAGAVIFAAFAGLQIGKALKEQFLEVELFGIALAAGLTKSANVIKNAFIITWGTIKAGALSTFNSILERFATYYDRLAEFQRRIPGIGNSLAGVSDRLASSMRAARVETETAEGAYKRLAATAEAELAAIDREYAGIADAAIAARKATEEVATTADPEGGNLAKGIAAAADQFALLKDAAERALVELEQRYEDFAVSTRDYFAEKIRLQQASIDADLAAARADAATATTSEARKAALTQIILLERQRRRVAVDGARDQVKAEEDLVRQLGEVHIRLLELSGQGARARAAQLEEQYRDLLRRLDVNADAAGKELVRKLINVEAAKAGLEQFKTEFQNVTGALSQLQQTTSAQVAAGLLSNATAEDRLKQARADALVQLTQQREAVAALYQQYKDPQTLLHLQQLDQQIAELSLSTEDWRGKIQDAATDALGTFFTDLATGAKSASEAVRDLALNFAKAMAQMAAQALAKKAIQGVMDLFSGGGKEGDGGGAQIANAAAAGLAYAAPVSTAALALTTAGGTVVAGASALAASAAALQAAATTLLVANSVSVAHTGGIAGFLGGSRKVSPLLFMGAPRYHTGGIAGLSRNEVPAILERGEEVLTKTDPRHRRNGGMGAQAGAGDNGLRLVLIDDARRVGDFLESAEGERVLTRVVQRNQLTTRS